MALIRFGAECDRCHIKHANYSVEDIASCNDCGLDLCDQCSDATGHKLVREADEGRPPLRSCEALSASGIEWERSTRKFEEGE